MKLDPILAAKCAALRRFTNLVPRQKLIAVILVTLLSVFGFISPPVSAGRLTDLLNRVPVGSGLAEGLIEVLSNTAPANEQVMRPAVLRAGEIRPDIQVVKPEIQKRDLRRLPIIPPLDPGFKMPEFRRHQPIKNATQNVSLLENDDRKSIGSIAAEDERTKPFLDGVPLSNMPGINIGFDGLDRSSSGCNCSPPDTQGDVGSDHYIQNVNATTFRIWDKTGNVLLTSTLNTLWGTTGSNPCTQGKHFGDPFVFYDHLADRWILTDFAFGTNGSNTVPPYYECVAVSRSSDPVAGGWYLYAFQADPNDPDWINDYPKFGMWPDAWYSSYNMFCGGNSCTRDTFEGVQLNVYDRTTMLAGAATSTQIFRLTPAETGDSYSLLPATFRFGTPPAGRNEFFASIDSPSTADWNTTLDKIHIWKLHSDIANPTNSSLTGPTDVTVNGFTNAWDSTARTEIVPQPGTSIKIDTVGDRLFSSLWYQNLGGVESLWATHTSNDTNVGPTAIRWYQFDVTGNTVAPTPVQQGDIAGGSLYRWMPSLSVDQNGDMAIGYNASSSSAFPSIRYNGRVTTDALCTLGQGESTMVAGNGSFIGSSRWGDYSSTGIDPSDGCTFWHTNEYVGVTGGNWMTRVGNFTLPQCAGTGTLTGTVTNANGGAAIDGATVTAGPNTTTTNASGVYTFIDITAGKYNVTVSAPTFNPATHTGIVVASGDTKIEDFSLTSGPQCGEANVWCSVTSRGGGILWNSANTWDRGTVPAAGADVIVRPYSGTYNSNNFVALNGNANVHSITIQTNANAGVGGSAGTFIYTIRGDLLIEPGGLLRDVHWTDGETITYKIGGNFINDGTMGGISTGATYSVNLQFNGTGAQSVGGGGGIRALGGDTGTSAILVSNTSAAGVTFSANINTTNAAGNGSQVTINPGALVKFSDPDIRFIGNGSLTLNGLTEIKATTFNGHYAMTGTRNIGSGSTITFKNPASTITPTTDIPTAALGNLIIDTGAGTATLGGGITVAGNLTLNSGILVAGVRNIDVAGNWTNTGGSFSGGTGTVTLIGGNQTITGSTTFRNMSKDVTTARILTFDSAGTQTITGTLALRGTSGHLLSLRSGGTGTQWTINAQGDRDVAFVDVKDSLSSNALPIDAGSSSVDSGNNTNWLFGQPPTSLAVSPAIGTFGGVTNLSATLTSGGTVVSGRSVVFTLNGANKGTAATNAAGVAALAYINLSGINAGSYSSGVGARFNGDTTFGGSSGTAALTVNKANANCAVPGYTVVYDALAHISTGSCLGGAGETLAGLDLSGTTRTDPGIYTDVWTFTDPTGNYNNAGSNVTDTIRSGTVTGHVVYSVVSKPVPNVTLSAPGLVNVSGTTNSSGVYSLSKFGAGAYTVTPSRTAQPCGTVNGVMAYDASLIAQHVVGLTTLSPAAIEAGKVSGLADLSTFDAGLIAQWIVCIDNPINLSGKWKFSPAGTSHDNMIGENLTENYTATMMGDVSGDWNPALPSRPLVEDPNGVRVSVSDSTAPAGSIVTIPLSIDNLAGKGVTSYQFDIEYDPSILQPVGNAAETVGTNADGLTVFSNASVPGQLKVVAFGAFPAKGDGVYAKLRFVVVGRAGTSSPLSIRRFSFNDGSVATTTTAGSVTLTAADHAGSITGRLILPDGRGLGRSRVNLTGPSGQTFSATTNSFGYFAFEGLTVGETYTISVESKRYRFDKLSVTVIDNMAEVVLAAEP